jgi:hypothetical protein
MSKRSEPRLEDVSTHLTKLLKAFNTLRESLHEPDEDETLAKIHAIRAFEREFENSNPGQLVTNDASATAKTLNATQLRRLCVLAARAAAKVIEESRVRAQHEPAWPLANFLGRLEKWASKIGVPATARKDDPEISSAFVSFVKAVVSEIPKKYRPPFNSDNAIATRISEARKIRRTFGSDTA